MSTQVSVPTLRKHSWSGPNDLARVVWSDFETYAGPQGSTASDEAAAGLVVVVEDVEVVLGCVVVDVAVVVGGEVALVHAASNSVMTIIAMTPNLRIARVETR